MFRQHLWGAVAFVSLLASAGAAGAQSFPGDYYNRADAPGYEDAVFDYYGYWRPLKFYSPLGFYTALDDHYRMYGHSEPEVVLLSRLTGQVVRIREMGIPQDRHLFADLRTPGGTMVSVDIGPTLRPDVRNLRVGDLLTVRGRRLRLHYTDAFLAQRVVAVQRVVR